MSLYPSRNCPICGSGSPKPGYEVASSRRAEDLTFEELSSLWRGFRKDNVFFTYRRCKNCGLLYCPKYFSNSQLGELYKSMEDNLAGESVETVSHTQRRYVQRLDLSDLNGVWLDFGADIGLCSSALLENSGVERVDAVEPNMHVHETLARNLGPSGQIFSDISQASQTYKGLIAIHVLDHVPDLESVLIHFKSVLIKGGVASVVVHSERTLLRFVLNRKWPPFCLQHPQVFNKESLMSALKNAGFSVESLSRTTNVFSTKYILTTALTLFGMRRIPIGLIPDVSIPIKLGNIQVIVRKKD